MECPPPNQFLYSLFSKSNSLLSHCGNPGSIVILAPVASSLNAVDAETGLVYADNLTDEFVQSHILRIVPNKDEVLIRSRARVYMTINGKSIVVKEDVIYPHRGFKGVREVRILHDSLFWLNSPGSAPYLVYFLDRPLSGLLMPDPYSPLATSHGKLKINTWKDLTQSYASIGNQLNPIFAKICTEFIEAVNDEEQRIPASASESLRSRHGSTGQRLRRQSGSSIAPAPLQRTNTSQSFSESPNLQFLRIRVDLLLNSAMQAFQSLPQATLHTLSEASHLTGTDIERLIESRMLSALYDIIFFKLTGITETRDEEIAAALEGAKHVDLSQLGIKATRDLRARIDVAVVRFKDFGREHEPLHKIRSLLDTVNILMLNSEKSSDELIPSLVSVVLSAGISHLCANLLWIREFAFIDVDGGEYGFAISTLEAVIYHITSSATSLAQTSRMNEHFLNAIMEGKLEIVEELTSTSPELLEIRSFSGSTPHQLADPSILHYLLTRSYSVSSLSGLVIADIPSDLFSRVLECIMILNIHDQQELLNEVDDEGKTVAHKIPDRMEFFDQIYDRLNWQTVDKQGNTPLQVLARIYDHPLYDILFERVLRTLTCGLDAFALDNEVIHDSARNVSDVADHNGQHDTTAVLFLPKQRIKLSKHIDAKGNTIAHVVSTLASMTSVFQYCSGNFNRTNDKGLTPLLISIKFARLSLVEFLLSRPEVNSSTRDFRGHSAIHYAARGSLALFNICVRAGLDVNDRASGSGISALHIASREGNIAVLKRLIELDAEDAWDWRGFRAGDVVKNDAVRNIMDEWACCSREIRVLRGHVGDDCTVNYLIKSRSGGGVLRTVKEFQRLRYWLVNKYPAVGIPQLQLQIPDPCQIHSRPSRAVLLAVTERLDAFVASLLDIEATKHDPLLWEFLLSPILDDKSITHKIDKDIVLEKAQIWRDEKALSAYESTRLFFSHAQEQILQLSYNYQICERKARSVKDGQLHLSVAYGLVGKSLAPLEESGISGHIQAIEAMSDSLVAREPSLLYRLIEDIITMNARVEGLLGSLRIPESIIERMEYYTQEIQKGEKSLSKSPKLQLNLSLLIDSQSRKKAMIRDDLVAAHTELEHAGSELRHNEVLLADNLSSFYRAHEKGAIGIIRKFCGQQASMERIRLEGMQRALAIVKSASRGE